MLSCVMIFVGWLSLGVPAGYTLGEVLLQDRQAFRGMGYAELIYDSGVQITFGASRTLRPPLASR